MAEAALVADGGIAVFHDHHALAEVRVHRVGGKADGILGDAFVFAVRLGHHISGNHAPPFADIELVRPVAGVLELIRIEAELRGAPAQLRWHLGIVGQEIQQPLLVGEVILENPLTQLVKLAQRDGQPTARRRHFGKIHRLEGAVGPAVAAVHEIRGKASGVVRIPVAHLHRAVLHRFRGVIEHPFHLRAEVQETGEQAVSRGIVTLGFREGDAAFLVGEDHAEIVSLHPLIPLPRRSRLVRRDFRQQAGRRIVRHHIGADGQSAELIDILPGNRLPLPAQRFTVSAVRLAPDGVGNVRRRHQVALVGRIDEHRAFHSQPGFEGGGNNAVAYHLDRFQRLA